MAVMNWVEHWNWAKIVSFSKQKKQHEQIPQGKKGLWVFGSLVSLPGDRRTLVTRTGGKVSKKRTWIKCSLKYKR
jgi:hypothetical protein